MRAPRWSILFAALLCAPWGLAAQVQIDSGLVYDQSNAMVPTRDAVRLNTDTYTPRGMSGPLPIILLRTPYGVTGAGQGLLTGYLRELAR